jgi:hypothetical protein
MLLLANRTSLIVFADNSALSTWRAETNRRLLHTASTSSSKSCFYAKTHLPSGRHHVDRFIELPHHGAPHAAVEGLQTRFL